MLMYNLRMHIGSFTELDEYSLPHALITGLRSGLGSVALQNPFWSISISCDSYVKPNSLGNKKKVNQLMNRRHAVHLLSEN